MPPYSVSSMGYHLSSGIAPEYDFTQLAMPRRTVSAWSFRLSTAVSSTDEERAGFRAEMQKLGAFFRQEGMYVFINWNNLFTNPPLCITEEQLRQSFLLIDRALEITDAAVVR